MFCASERRGDRDRSSLCLLGCRKSWAALQPLRALEQEGTGRAAVVSLSSVKQAGETSNLEPRGPALRLLPSEAIKHTGPVYGFDITPEKKIKKKDGAG